MNLVPISSCPLKRIGCMVAVISAISGCDKTDSTTMSGRSSELPEFHSIPESLESEPVDIPSSTHSPIFTKQDKRKSFSEQLDEELARTEKRIPARVIIDNPFKGKPEHAAFLQTGVPWWMGRRSTKRNALARGGGGSDTERAVLEALKWLSRHQNSDGSWDVTEYTQECRKACVPNPGHADFKVGVTGLAVLAFIGSGYSHLSRDNYDGIYFGNVVRKGLTWLLAQQDVEGCIGSRTSKKYMYGHAIASIALAEEYRLTHSFVVATQAQKAIDFLVASQNPRKGWRYSYRAGDSDSSVTGWATLALKSAEYAGLRFPKSCFEGIRGWYNEVTESADSRVAYLRDGISHPVDVDARESFDHHELPTATGVLARILIDRNKADPRLRAGIRVLMKDAPKWSGASIDFTFWHWAGMAIFQYDGPGGFEWHDWNKEMKTALLSRQNGPKSGCQRGSWEPVGRWCHQGGRVYATAINTLTLEIYYRHPPVFASK